MAKGSKRTGSVTLLPNGQVRMSLGSGTMKRHGQEARSFWTLYAPAIGTYYLTKKQEAHLKGGGGGGRLNLPAEWMGHREGAQVNQAALRRE